MPRGLLLEISSKITRDLQPMNQLNLKLYAPFALLSWTVKKHPDGLVVMFAVFGPLEKINTTIDMKNLNFIIPLVPFCTTDYQSQGKNVHISPLFPLDLCRNPS